MLIDRILILIEIIFSLGVGWYAFRRKSISLTGFIALILICALFICLQQIGYLFILFCMFASSSLLSKFKAVSKLDIDKVTGTDEPRNAMQAICNLGIAVLAFICFYFTEDTAFIYAFLGSVATSNADTWASEIGSRSKQTPVLITNFKKTEKGLSGGITALGTIAGVFGALFISCMGLLAIKQNYNSSHLFAISFSTGIIGFLIDSYLGALFQAKYADSATNCITEVNNGNLVKGFPWLTNNGVNLLSTLLGAILAFYLYKITAPH